MTFIEMSGTLPQPEKCTCIHALDGYETYKIDDNTIGVRPLWIRVEQRLPEDGKDVLVSEKYRSLKTVKIGHRLGGSDPIWVDDHGYPMDKVTHWMPLPKPPE